MLADDVSVRHLLPPPEKLGKGNDEDASKAGFTSMTIHRNDFIHDFWLFSIIP
jgi:hypothetical protein